MRTPLVALALLLVGCAASTPTSPPASAPPSASLSDPEQKLAQAEAELAKHPKDPNAWIWKGRRQGYLGRYDDAIATFTEGLKRFPTEARFLRHRGHRWISKREFAKAEVDLARAWRLDSGREDEIEPDGLPNAANVPTSTTKGNIGYHWGLALYLQGKFGEAAEVYRKTLPFARHPDMEVAVRYWWTLSLRQMQSEEAKRAMAFASSEPLLESFAYERLLMVMRGELKEEVLLAQARADRSGLDFSTIGYGLAAHRALSGNVEGAKALLTELTSEPASAAFGRIAAEVELKRLEGARP
jgi:tetratricopeptide (TPR) repeat protein